MRCRPLTSGFAIEILIGLAEQVARIRPRCVAYMRSVRFDNGRRDGSADCDGIQDHVFQHKWCLHVRRVDRIVSRCCGLSFASFKAGSWVK